MGWKSKIALKRATYGVTINKLVAEGNCLVKGSELYCYLAEDDSGRKIMIVYLDGRKKNENMNRKAYKVC